jgi:pimeloyl-ACP methyl ester carboxylesterase
LGAARALRWGEGDRPGALHCRRPDLVVRFPGSDQLIANLKNFVPKLTKTIMLPGCGHWTQQERPDEVNAALIAFLGEVG